MRKLSLLPLVLFLIVAGCGGGGTPTDTPVSPTETAAAGDAAAGEALFHQTTIDSLPGCVTCHSLEPDKVIVGPSLAGVASRAGSRVSGLSTEQYLHQSILEPSAYVVEGFPDGVMPSTYGDVLSEKQVNDLVAFLMTLR